MKKISVTLAVDESALMKECEGTGATTLHDAISQELSWLHDSGISVETWSFVAPEQERSQLLLNSLLNYLVEQYDSRGLYHILHHDLELSHDDIDLLAFDLSPYYEQAPCNTKISYLYRDADNYKTYNECIVAGSLSESQQKTIIDCLHEGEYFIPRQVGLPEKRFDDGWTDADHCWFELSEDSFESTADTPTIALRASDLVEAFVAQKDRWDDSISGPVDHVPTPMDLHNFLAYFDFDYDIVLPGGEYEDRIRQELIEDGNLSAADITKPLICLIDLQGAYFGDIGKMRYPIDPSSVSKIVDRMDIYIQDSVIDEFTTALSERGIDPSSLSLGEMISQCKTLGVGDGEVSYLLAELVNHPESIFIKELQQEKTEAKESLNALIHQAQEKAAASHTAEQPKGRDHTL